MNCFYGGDLLPFSILYRIGLKGTVLSTTLCGTVKLKRSMGEKDEYLYKRETACFET